MLTDGQLIQEAISRHESIEFSFDGYRRVVHPHIIGKDKEGVTTLFAWQTLSGKGSPPGWRHFRLDGLTGLLATGRYFEPQSPRPIPDKCGFVEVFAQA
jgi:hypothetical protein